MALKIPPVGAHSLELALQSWFDWFDSLRTAREQLGWKSGFTSDEWQMWSKGLGHDLVWDMAFTTLDRLNLPRLFAGYWIACLVSRYDSEEIRSFINIEYPDWVTERLQALIDTLLHQKPPFGHEASDSIVQGQGIPDRLFKRALPPSYVGVAVTGPASFVTIHIPLFMLPGLIYDPSSLQELLKEIVNQRGKHPLSEFLKRVGRSVGWEWERSKVKEVRDDQLRPLYNYLMKSEYYREILESSSEKKLKKAVKSLDASIQDEWLLAHSLEAKVGQSERRKIRNTVRKRVSGWFKDADRWPLPEE